jgi:hypothetical protein
MYGYCNVDSLAAIVSYFSQVSLLLKTELTFNVLNAADKLGLWFGTVCVTPMSDKSSWTTEKKNFHIMNIKLH